MLGSIKTALTIAVLIIATGFGASAAPNCLSLSGTNVASLTGCDLGPFNFTNFQVSSAPPGSGIYLQWFGTGYINGEWDLGFQVVAANLPPLDLLLSYQVTGPLVGVSNYHNGGLGARIQEVVCAVPLSAGICPSGQSVANIVNPPTGSATFAELQIAYIAKDIQFAGPDAFLSSFVNGHIAAEAPEPFTWMLIGGGLLAIAATRRFAHS